MASELAANTLHAQAVVGAGGGGDRLGSVLTDVEGEPIQSAGPAPQDPTDPETGNHRHRPPGSPRSQGRPPPRAPRELWLYLRGVGMRARAGLQGVRLLPGLAATVIPVAAALPPVTPWAARGLQLVHELSCGRWGHHPTRARLGRWGVRGKAVWFAVPAPLAHARLVDVTGLTAYTGSADVTATRASERLSARQAARELQAMLDERGFGGELVRADQPDSDPRCCRSAGA